MSETRVGRDAQLAPEMEMSVTRNTLLRHAGLAAGAVVVIGAGALGVRAADRGVFATGSGPAYEPWTSWQAERGLRRLVAAAVLAPSPHNAQAWRFELERRRIDIFADHTRRTGAIDPFDRELVVGLGAALENVVLAARANGLAPHVELLPTPSDPTHVARVTVAAAAVQANVLAAQIPRRHTNRYAFVGDRDVPRAALDGMSALADGAPAAAQIVWHTAPRQRRQVGASLVAATEAIVSDPAQSASDTGWFRQDWDTLQRLRDGITLDAAGLPDLTAALAKLLPDQSPDALGESWLRATRDRHTTTAAAYGVVVVRDATADAQRLDGGRLLQRAHLWATAHDLAFHHMNQITERTDRERQLGLPPRFSDAAAELAPDGWEPLVMFSIGYPTRPGRPSPRRPVSWVIRAQSG